MRAREITRELGQRTNDAYWHHAGCSEEDEAEGQDSGHGEGGGEHPHQSAVSQGSALNGHEGRAAARDTASYSAARSPDASTGARGLVSGPRAVKWRSGGLP